MTVVTRVLALAVAVGLVLGALALRGADDGSGRDDGAAPAVADSRLVCPIELTGPCTAAAPGEVTTAAAEEVAARLAADGDVALLPAAWADVVDDDRTRRGGAALERSDVLASTPLLLVGFADRAAVLAEVCGIEVADLGWACIGAHVGERWEDLGGDPRWGDVRIGHLPPSTATGLQATAGVVAARTGLPFSLAELRDVGVASWFRRVERGVPSFRPPGGSFLTGMVTRGPAAANLATVTEAELSLRGLTTTFGSLVVSAPDPLFVVDLVVVGGDAGAVADAAARLDVDAFVEAGWRTDPATAPPGAPAAGVGEPDQTPSGGVLTAVRSAWSDAVG